MEPESFYETMMYQGITIEHKLQIDNPLFLRSFEKTLEGYSCKGARIAATFICKYNLDSVWNL